MAPRPSQNGPPIQPYHPSYSPTADGSASTNIWIFGYGSLCWKPDFDYLDSVTGYVKGYSRKFWQGNTAHRGTSDKPGRVATLVEEDDGEVWGVGYKVGLGSPVLDYLWERECILGGYSVIQVTFYPIGQDSVQGLAYLATPSSPGWLGSASIVDIAEQIATATGPAGTNSEYVCRLATWIRSNTPVSDPHLDLLDLLVRSALEDIRVARIKIEQALLNSVKSESVEANEDSKVIKLNRDENTVKSTTKSVTVIGLKIEPTSPESVETSYFQSAPSSSLVKSPKALKIDEDAKEEESDVKVNPDLKSENIQVRKIESTIQNNGPTVEVFRPNEDNRPKRPVAVEIESNTDVARPAAGLIQNTTNTRSNGQVVKSNTNSIDRPITLFTNSHSGISTSIERSPSPDLSNSSLTNNPDYKNREMHKLNKEMDRLVLKKLQLTSGHSKRNEHMTHSRHQA